MAGDEQHPKSSTVSQYANAQYKHPLIFPVAKVYRRDQPAVARGRMREFWQCDFDIAGETDPMISESEILRIIFEVFRALKIDVTVKLNHRRILTGVFTVAGLPADKIRTVSAEVDKLDKMDWSDVKKAMIEEKGVEEDVADRIGAFVQHHGSITEILKYLKSDEKLLANEDIKAGYDEMSLLETYLKALDADKNVSFDLSLARGLDYYTGVIYECIVENPPQLEEGKKEKGGQASLVGSIAAGGRYDNLVGIFGKKQIPCIGISFGVDRIFTILKAQKDLASQPTSETDVYVMSFGGKDFNGLLLERMSLVTELWDAGIRAEFTPKVKAKLPAQFKLALDVPLAVILGEDELAAGKYPLQAHPD
jgi:histidyl-tRNA synthetase